MTSTSTNLSVQQLKKATAIKTKIDSLERELDKILGAKQVASNGGPRKRRKMSAASKARIAAAQKARWARQKQKTLKPRKSTSAARKSTARKSGARKTAAGKGRGKMSPEVKARIAEGQRRRWARIKRSKAAK